MAKYIRSKYTRLPKILYDDDGIRVKTIYVSNIRESTTSDSLERKYSVYGPVQSCTLECHPDSDEVYAVITMDYAFDAAKILNDWPEDVKHLYRLLPKRMTGNKANGPAQDVPKKQITEIIKLLIEVPVIVTHQIKCTEQCPSSVVIENVRSEPLVSENKEVNREVVVPTLRRRRPAGSTSTTLKKRVTKKSTRVDETDIKSNRQIRAIVQESISVLSEPSISEPSTFLKNKPVVETHCYQTPSNASPPTEDIENNPFTSLNDDCLISIFSSCDKLDLVSLSQVCERFSSIVNNYLKGKISKIVDLSKIKCADKITLTEAKKFLQFIDAAKNMQQLELTMSAFRERKDQLILEEIFKCCGPNLHRITFTGFSFMEGFTTEWKQLFHRFECLTFHKCIFSTNNFSELLKFCESLEVLNLTSSHSNAIEFDDDMKNEFSEFKCNKLKEFRLTSSRHLGKSSELIWLLENNPNLRVLQISDVGDYIKLNGEILQCIGQLREMQDLAFSFQNFVTNLVNNLHHLIRLKELKSLCLQCDWMNISTFIRELAQAANKQIEKLSFECIDIDTSFVKNIGKFRKLKYLKLENTVVNEPSQEVFEQSLMDLTYRLNNLTNFHCQLHLFTEDSLVQFVERMKKLEHLQISGLVMNLILCMRFVSACGRRINGLKLNIVIDNYQYLNEYLDLIRSEYGNVIGIQSLYD